MAYTRTIRIKNNLILYYYLKEAINLTVEIKEKADLYGRRQDHRWNYITQP